MRWKVGGARDWIKANGFNLGGNGELLYRYCNRE